MMDRNLMKATWKYIVEMIGSLLSAFILTNCLTYFYFNNAHAITNVDRYTTNKFVASKHNYYGIEGYGITSTDNNGFYNNGTILPQYSNLICIGSSQTEAVHTSKNYVFYLNELNSSYNAYNLGASGQFMSQSLYRLPYIRLSKIFPACKVIICETPYLPTLDEWRTIIKCLETCSAPVENHDWKDAHFLFRLYRLMPYARLLHRQFNKLFAKTNEMAQEVDMAIYRSTVDCAMRLLRERLGDMPLIIMYLPRVHLEKDGQIAISNDDERQKILKEACEANHIIYVYDQLSTAFIENYATHRILPYGFLNSHIGQGHLNADGHRMIAETLHKILQEEGLGQ